MSWLEKRHIGFLLGSLLPVAAILVSLLAWWQGWAAELWALALKSLQHWQAFYQNRPWSAVLIAAGAYVLITALSVPVANVLSVVYGMVFGFWVALVLVSVASTAGATLAMLGSRYFVAPWVRRRWGAALQRMQPHLAQHGPWYLFSLRLAPVVPFWLVNLLVGVVPIRVWTFWWVSQLGMLPGTILYVATGASLSLERLSQQGVPGVLTPTTVLLLCLLAVFPWMARIGIRRLGPRKENTEPF